MKPLATVANLAWLATSLPAYQRFCQALKQPAETQTQLLCTNLSRNAHCAYGKKYRYAGIHTYKEFAERVPLADYDDLKPWIARIRQGEQQVLTTEPVGHLIPTSGSTCARKLIPFTLSLQREFNAAISPWMVDLFRSHPSIVFGPAYWSVSPARELENPGESSVVPIGFDDDSAYLGGAKQWLLNKIMAAPGELRHVPDLERFRYLLLLSLLRQADLRLISIWHPSFLTLLLEVLPDFWNSLVEDIGAGQCKDAGNLPVAIRQAFVSPPLPYRAKQLQAANPLEPSTLWSRLKVISCWGEGSAELGIAELKRLFPQVVIQPKGLLATEAFVTVPFKGQHPLAICSHFFEFEDKAGKIYLAHELKKEKVYETIVTTAGGLWRYRLRDQVEVTGFVSKTPSLRFLGRAGSVSDICGEKLAEAFVAQAIQEACSTLTQPPQFAMLAPEEDPSCWHYTLYIEGNTAADMDKRLDSILRHNPHYAYCRDLGQLGPLQVFSITHSGFAIFAGVEMASGQKLGDIKPRALSDRKDWSQHFSGVACKANQPSIAEHI